jgi:hypothetical protein
MPLAPHHRITYSGILGPVALPIETWSFSLNTDGSAGLGDIVTAGTAAAARQSFATYLAPMLPGDIRLTRTRVAAVGADGRVFKSADGMYQQQDDETGVDGLRPPNQLPASAALVVSLMTPRAGATGRGRVFLPFPAFIINQQTKLLSDADTTNVATNFRAFVTDLNANPGLGVVVVASKYGYVSPVTRVRVGHRPDVLRSRSRSQAEAYVVSSPV